MKSDPIKDFGYKPKTVEKYSNYIGKTIGNWKILDFAQINIYNVNYCNTRLHKTFDFNVN